MTTALWAVGGNGGGGNGDVPVAETQTVQRRDIQDGSEEGTGGQPQKSSQELSHPSLLGTPAVAAVRTRGLRPGAGQVAAGTHGEAAPKAAFYVASVFSPSSPKGCVD